MKSNEIGKSLSQAGCGIAGCGCVIVLVPLVVGGVLLVLAALAGAGS